MVMSSPGGDDAGLAEGDLVTLLRHEGIGRVEQAMLDENHRIVVADRGDQAALGVVGVGRRDDLEARHVHEHRVQALRMLRALAPRFADHAAHHQRHLDLAAVHVAAFGGDVDELVHAQHQKVHADVHVDRPHAGHRRADRNAGHGVFR